MLLTLCAGAAVSSTLAVPGTGICMMGAWEMVLALSTGWSSSDAGWPHWRCVVCGCACMQITRTQHEYRLHTSTNMQDIYSK